MKTITYSKSGRFQKSRKTTRRKIVKVSWGECLVPRDTGGFIARPYPLDETGYGNGRERQLRRYANSTGESKMKGKRVTVLPTVRKPVRIVVGKPTKAVRRKTHKAYSVADLLKGGLK